MQKIDFDRRPRKAKRQDGKRNHGRDGAQNGSNNREFMSTIGVHHTGDSKTNPDDSKQRHGNKSNGYGRAHCLGLIELNHVRQKGEHKPHRTKKPKHKRCNAAVGLLSLLDPLLCRLNSNLRKWRRLNGRDGIAWHHEVRLAHWTRDSLAGHCTVVNDCASTFGAENFSGHVRFLPPLKAYSA